MLRAGADGYSCVPQRDLDIPEIMVCQAVQPEALDCHASWW